MNAHTPKYRLTGLLLAVILLCFTSLAQADVGRAPQNVTTAPTVVTYQGKITGTPNGPRFLKFVVINTSGSISYWSNDATSVAGSQPAASVPILVTSGAYSVLLGDTSLSGMTSALPASVFSTSDRRLRVWFGTKSNGSFTLVTPDALIPASAYALNAETLDGLDSSAFSYTAGSGLAVNGNQFSVVTSTVQTRVSGSCAVGSSIRAIAADGTVTCDAPTTLYSPLLQAQSVDLAAVDPDLKSFSGGFTDGRYAYFVPFNNGAGVNYGKVARLDLQNFTTSGVTVLDLTTVDAGLVDFFGGFTDGRYGYFVPNSNGGHGGKVARVDLQNFTTSGVTVLDLVTVDTSMDGGFVGGFTDGRYGYFVPNYNCCAFHSKVARVDLQNFTTGGVTVLDLAAADAGLAGFNGGFTDGRYGYFVPNNNGIGYDGKVARVDLQNFTTSGVTVLDLAAVDASLAGFLGGFTDGRYGYFVPYGPSGHVYSGKIARVNLQNFTTGGVTVLDLAAVDTDLKGFYGGFTDGRYGYFVPHTNGDSLYSGKVARVDLQNFAAGGVTVLDLAAVDAGLRGFNGGFTDGRYGYFVPWNGYTSGKVARIQLFSGVGSP